MPVLNEFKNYYPFVEPWFSAWNKSFPPNKVKVASAVLRLRFWEPIPNITPLENIQIGFLNAANGILCAAEPMMAKGVCRFIDASIRRTVHSVGESSVASLVLVFNGDATKPAIDYARELFRKIEPAFPFPQNRSGVSLDGVAKGGVNLSLS